MHYKNALIKNLTIEIKTMNKHKKIVDELISKLDSINKDFYGVCGEIYKLYESKHEKFDKDINFVSSPHENEDFKISNKEFKEIKYNGFNENEITQIPIKIELSQILYGVSENNEITTYAANSGYEKALMNMNLLFNRISDSYAALLTCVNININKKFFDLYEKCLPQVIHEIFFNMTHIQHPLIQKDETRITIFNLIDLMFFGVHKHSTRLELDKISKLMPYNVKNVNITTAEDKFNIRNTMKLLESLGNPPLENSKKKQPKVAKHNNLKDLKDCTNFSKKSHFYYNECTPLIQNYLNLKKLDAHKSKSKFYFNYTIMNHDFLQDYT
ncbi:hypothetical protein A3Q56_00457 [Intoshia linei]|uniref:Uncharacterized protein n=1 Tax=Intoshia linei TaxID=1819745 RepID=A0A177BC02_9BILA|nr:hypothetical protein A3Q56_00457 [Intoshia linei]